MRQDCVEMCLTGLLMTPVENCVVAESRFLFWLVLRLILSILADVLIFVSVEAIVMQ